MSRAVGRRIGAQGGPGPRARVAARLSEIMRDRGLPDLIETYASWFVINVTEADPLATLLYPLMRLEGVHVLDGFCCFLTTAHTEADCARVVAAFETALDALLWVKPPAESDGTCHGGPPAGDVWIDRALALATAAGW